MDVPMGSLHTPTGASAAAAAPANDPAYLRGMERLVTAIQDLSLARDLPAVMAVVRRAARDLTGADGATFVLRDDEMCFYADEDAIEPLWKGSRFPLGACVSGWAMLHQEPVVIPDIYADPRVPADAYRPTFVKSLALVPIRTASPIGAIGNYWASPHRATAAEVKLLQALADSTSVAIENVQLYADLEHRVQERTAQLEHTNKELEAFSYSVSHDLRAPLRSIDGFSQALAEDLGDKLDPTSAGYLQRVRGAAKRMSDLIDDLLELSRTSRANIERQDVDVTALALDVAQTLEKREPARHVSLEVQPGLHAHADPRLLRVVFENLLGNAWKFTGKQAEARVEIAAETGEPGEQVFRVRDNGAGFDMQFSAKLFAPFQRLHDAREFTGTGVGLATVQRIVHRHGGRIWAEGHPGEGAVFRFTLAR
jgi:signal transduction histidine kinase